MNRLELKSLETQLKKAEIEHEALKDQQRELSKKISLSSDKVTGLMQRIAAFKAVGDLVVSEHAILRYLERMGIVDVGDLEKRIATEDIKKQVELLGDGKYPLGSLRAVVRNNTVVTVED